MSQTLVRYDAMRTAITAAHSIDEVKDIRDKALALELYARQANDRHLERKVHEIRVRADRRSGELLRVMPKANGARGHPGPGRGKTGSPVSRPFCAEPTIKDFGITHVQSAQWQKLADVPEEEFEAEIANPVALPSAAIIIAAHEARNRPEAPPSKPVDSRALWLWGRLLDFKRDGLLTVDPNELLNTMLGGMENDTRELAPLVSAWLGRIGQ